jgi:hypothetical protein
MTILAINGITDDPSMLWQAEAIRESEGGTVKVYPGSTLESLDNALSALHESGERNVVVLWDKSLQRDAEDEYGQLFERLEFVDRQYVLREGDPKQTAPAPVKAPVQQPPAEEPKKSIPTVFIVNPCNACVVGTKEAFPSLVAQLNQYVTSLQGKVEFMIVDHVVNRNVNWMFGTGLTIIKLGFKNVTDHIKNFLSRSYSFTDYKSFLANAQGEFSNPNLAYAIVPPGSPLLQGKSPNIVKYGDTLPISNIVINAQQINPGACESSFKLGSQILKDVQEDLDAHKAKKETKIKVDEKAVKKYIEDNNQSKRTHFLCTNVLPAVLSVVDGSAEQTMNKKHSANDDEFKKRIAKFAEVMGIKADLETAENIVNASGAGLLLDAAKGLKSLTQSDKTKTNDGKTKTGTATVEAKRLYVSHPQWESFQKLFDEDIGKG